MSQRFCREVYTLIGNGPVANLPEVILPEVTYWEPPQEDLVGAVRSVCSAGWFRALANRRGVHDLLEDIEQTTFLRVWQVRDTFLPDIPVICRVARIARNVLIDAARYRGRRLAASLHDENGEQIHFPADGNPGPLDLAIRREMETRLKQAISEAPELIQRILALREQDLTFEQIAADLSKEKSAITSAYHRWKVAMLKKLLGNQDQDA